MAAPVGPTVTAVLATATTATTFAPWGSSGTRARSSYGIIDVVERAGVLSATAADVSGLWFFVPALCGAVLIGTALRRVRLAAAAATTLGLLVAVGAVLVARSPLVTEPAAIVGALVGTTTVLAGTWVLGTTTRGRGDE